MSFQVLEESREDGRPVALYEFTFGSTVWRYTSADEDIVANSQTWTAAAISDDGVRQTGEATADALTLNAPSWIGPAQIFMSGAPSASILLTIHEKHETNAEVRVVYSGEISQINYPLPGACKITCETISATLAREGLRLGWQRSCPYALYDPLNCKVNKAAYANAVIVTAINAKTITVEGIELATNGEFDNGFFEWTHPTRGIEYLPVELHINSTLTFSDQIGELFVGASGNVYPGCNFTPERCQEFGNYDNYGGAPLMPGKSPFDGDPVF